MVERNSSAVDPRGPAREPDATRSGGRVADDQLQIPDDAGGSRFTKLLVVGVVLAVLIGLGVYMLRPAPVPELYLVQAVTKRDIVQRIEAAGRLDVRRRVEIPAPAQGSLLSIHVRTGDQVETGQLLAVMDARAAALAVSSAEASAGAAASGVREAETAATAAQRTLERTRKLLERGLASDNDVANAQTELSRAEAARDAARANQRVAGQSVASAKLSKSLGQIVAPGTGVVLRAPERVGAAVSPEMGPLFVIGDPLDQMRIDAKVSETDIALLQVGQTAQITVSAIEGKTFSAKVERLGLDAELELGAVLYPVTLVVDNPEHLLRPGYSARVQMQVREAKQVLAVHEAALRFVPENAEPGELRTRVFKKIDTEQLEPIAVRPGISDGLYTAVEPVNGATLSVGDNLAIGFVRPEQGSRGPRVTLDKKK
ncbi:MAG: efflux RND transporter periplasmic adaptor subunit [Polyangiales bacterium]